MKKEDINDLTSNEKQKIIKQYLSLYKDLNTISELTGIKYHTVVFQSAQIMPTDIGVKFVSIEQK